MNWEAHNLQITEESGDLRVLAGGQSYLMKRINREAFLKQYREAWDRARLNFVPLLADNEALEFTPPERLRLRQRIILHWLYAYNANSRRFRLLWWRMGDSQTRWEVLKAAEARYGSKSGRAIALAAHTLNMSARKFGAWMKRYEEFVNRW